MKQHTQILIIGNGLSGTWLSYFLQKQNIDCILIDEEKTNTASKVASGIINPVTGLRYAKTLLVEEAMPFAVDAYKVFNCIEQKNMLDFFESYTIQAAFEKRIDEKCSYVNYHTKKWGGLFNYNLGIGEINPCYLVDVHSFLNQEKSNTIIVKEKFEEQYVQVNENNITYKNITAEKIIYCNGIAAMQSQYFKHLPFTPNKGEALIIECKDLPINFIYKNKFSIVPWASHLFWVGASFKWEFENDQPTINFKNEITNWLNNFIKLPYKIVEHVAAIRPANKDRKPFVGLHPQQKNIGILNGLGSKGVLHAPYFANKLALEIVKTV